MASKALRRGEEWRHNYDGRRAHVKPTMHYLVERGFVDGLPRRRTTADFITIRLAADDKHGGLPGEPWPILRDAAIPAGFVAAALDAGVGASKEDVRARLAGFGDVGAKL